MAEMLGSDVPEHHHLGTQLQQFVKNVEYMLGIPLGENVCTFTNKGVRLGTLFQFILM